MIKVKKPVIQKINGKIRIYCDYELNKTIQSLWYELDEDYADYLSVECCDAFFTILVLLAYIQGQNIVFEAPVSTRLYYGIIDILMPALMVVNPNLKAVNITVSTKDFNFNPKAVGTALSLGVDSFHALVSSLNGPYPVTHLTLFNSGAFGHEEHNIARALFKKTVERVSIAAAEMKLPLISVDSNMCEILDISFVQTHSIRNLSFALLFPKLFKLFYYASGYPVTKFRLDDQVGDATHYDLLVSKALCTQTFEVMIAGLYNDRIEKISTITSFSPSTRYLNVCILAESNQFLDSSTLLVKNCSRCFKCIKTMVALDALGKLNLYSEVFDLDVYKTNRNKYLGQIIYDAKKIRSSHAIEILKIDTKRKGFLSWKSYYYAMCQGFINLKKKL